MTENEKWVFIETLLEKVKAELLNKVETLPDEWDGIELRWLIRDAFDRIVITSVGGRKRKRDYKNFILISNTL